MSSENRKFAMSIAEKWGKFLTKAAKGGGIADFKSLFYSGPVYVVIQNEQGEETEFSIAESIEEGFMSWDEFEQVTFLDMDLQNYDRTESECLGVLGNRMILETGRFNKEGELYLTATSVLEFDAEGKIVGYEAFSDVGMDVLSNVVDI